MRFVKLLGLAGVGLLLAAAYAGYWFYVAGRVADGIDGWAAAQRAAGLDVRFENLRVDGFPFAVRAGARDVSIIRHDGLTYEAASLVASAPPWSWRTIGITIPRGARVTLPGSPAVTAAAGSGGGVLDLSPSGRIIGATMALEHLALALPAMDALIMADRAGLVMSEQTPEDATLPFLSATADVGRITLPAAPLPRFGAVIESAGLDVRLTGPLPSDITMPAVRGWRDAGGMIAVDEMSLLWGPLALQGTGTLALDEALQPEGTLMARITGFVETIDAFVEAGLMEPRPATFAKAGLSLLAEQPEDEDGRAVLTTPLTIADGTVSLGPLPLGPIPRLEWPRAADRQ